MGKVYSPVDGDKLSKHIAGAILGIEKDLIAVNNWVDYQRIKRGRNYKEIFEIATLAKKDLTLPEWDYLMQVLDDREEF